MSGPEDTISIDQFLDDFFSESDEHLTAVRRNLLLLEEQIGRPVLDPKVVNDLFRSFHTLKGLSGMVGLDPAEDLAHTMEDYLKILRQEPKALSREGITALIEGVNRLEKVIAAKKEGIPLPDVAAVREKLKALLRSDIRETDAATPPKKEKEEASPLSLDEEKAQRIQEARDEGYRIWVFEFTPSAALSERGINVNSVRARLQEKGELIHAWPKIAPGGGVSFAFVLASKEDQAVFSAWGEDGLSFSLYEEQSALQTEKGKPVGLDVGSTESTASVEEVPAGPAVTPSNIVRVDLNRLEDLMEMVGGLVISRARLEGQLKGLERVVPAAHWRALQETSQTIERQLRHLREGMMRIRMIPIGDVFNRMHFVIRDLVRESGKKARLELRGQETEIDKFVVERMMDPLLHLVRNAIAHGLEGPEERRAAGKSEEGVIRLSARTEGDMVFIEIADDGRGIDREAILRKAEAMGWVEGEGAGDLDHLLDILCRPEFSTRDEADMGAGRGVGMAVVKNAVTGLGGSLSLDYEAGKGTRFLIGLPLTLAIVDALIVRAGGQTFAVPQPAVREVIEVQPQAVTRLEKNELYNYRGTPLPMIRLDRFFGLPPDTGSRPYALVAGMGAAAAGIVVEKILSRREIVVRALTDPLVQVAGVAGATELGDGRAVLILDVQGLIREGRKK